jgi:phospholipid/cholesterol/gamma-HCH transport system ATP-binding protein
VSGAVLELVDITRNYHALRPLRIRQLTVQAGDQIALIGLDQHAAEVLVNLMTGATLPDQGEVRVDGRATSAISDSAGWLAVLDRFGIVSERAVLLETLSALQNLAMPFSLDIEPLDEALRERAIGLAREVGLDEGDWDRRLVELDGSARLRVRLGRALALEPGIVVLEHPSAGLNRQDVAHTGADIQHVLVTRQSPVRPPLASVTLTMDLDFAAAVATRVLTLDPVSGRLTERSRRGWFGRRTPSL